MAVALHRRGSGRTQYRPMSEINVTPMVDVMLVLLIVFMVAAPLMTAGVPLELPKSQAPTINENKETATISIRSNGDVYIQETQYDDDAMVAKLSALTNANKDAAIFVRGDQAINYGRVMEVMGLIAKAGYTKVNLVTEQATPGKKP